MKVNILILKVNIILSQLKKTIKSIYYKNWNIETQETYRRILPNAQLQNVSPKQIDTYILQFYTRIMKKFLADKANIPAGNLVEIKYEDLETTSLEQVRRVYETLNISGFTEIKPAMQGYLTSINDYQKNKYTIDDNVITKVNQYWQFAFDEWGYRLVSIPLFLF